jgi:glycosyltransferase involved in cell wall biosynthesis
MNPPHISVIVPARNESEHILACLGSLAAQEHAPATEIIVVDNASTDNTAELVRSFATAHAKANIRLIEEPLPGRGAARAAGFEAARGPVLLSTDADTTVPSDWVARLAAALANPRIVAVTGGCRIVDCPPLTNTLYNHIQPVAMRTYRLGIGHWWLTGANFGIKRSAYNRAGGFNTNCRDMEDVDLTMRVARLGAIKRLPRDLVVTTVGDRFQENVVRGFWQYLKAYFGRFWFHQGGRFDRAD